METYSSVMLIVLILSIMCGNISAMPSFFGLLDMTYNYDNNTLYWPTGRKFEKKTFESETNGNWKATGEFCSGEHAGTHMDAPYHFAKGKRSIEDIPLELLRGPAVVINITAKASRYADAVVAVEDIKAWEKKHGPVPMGAIVLMNSGWGKRWPNFRQFFGSDDPGDLANFHFPGFSPEVAEFLVNKRSIIGVGVDTPSLDNGKSTDMAVHRILSQANIFGLEYVANMHKVPEKGALVYALPMKISGGSGAPTRVFARIPPASAGALIFPQSTVLSAVLALYALLNSAAVLKC